MMNFKQYLAEKALNSKVFSQTLERLSDSAKMGFELEMWVPEDSDLLIISTEDSYKGDFMDTAKEAKKSLEDLLGYSVRINGESINQWRIVPDGSIQEEGIGCGIEIVSPPDPVADSLSDLKLMFKWMQKHDVVTNSSTGLHLNLSIPDLKDNLDALKLILFMGEEHVLGKYDRKFNSYAEQHKEEIINTIRDHGRIPKKLVGMEMVAGKALRQLKYKTVNLIKLDQGYLEFRTAGNDNYHKNFEKIEDDVGRFLTLLELACDPDAERQEYIKKLAKLFQFSIDKEKDVNNSTSLGSFIKKHVGPMSWGLLQDATSSPHGNHAELLHSALVRIGKRIVEKHIDVPLKIVAEFKVFLKKLEKQAPSVLKDAVKLSRNQVDIDFVKAFLKSFNIK